MRRGVRAEAGYNRSPSLTSHPTHRKISQQELYDTAKDLAVKMFGEKGEEVIE
jgi:hypothetical protein